MECQKSTQFKPGYSSKTRLLFDNRQLLIASLEYTKLREINTLLHVLYEIRALIILKVQKNILGKT